MTDNKKKIIYIVAAVLIVIAVSIGTVFILKASINMTTKTPAQSQTASAKAAADNLMLDATATKDGASAKVFLLKAREQYKAINDQDRVNAVDAMILMINNTETKK